MGLPKGTINMTYCPVSALPFRAYNLIYNEWFRDQNLQPSVHVDKDDGPDDPTSYALWKRGKRHDYFTSALPWPQKGPSVELPIGGSAPLSGSSIVQGNNQIVTFMPSGGGTSRQINFSTAGGTDRITSTPALPDGNFLKFGTQTGLEVNNSGVTADLSAATAATINQIREAFQIQRLYERDARGGTRYIEIIRSHFGVVSPDARLQLH